MLLATPALRALRAAGPADRSVTLLTSSTGAGLASCLPDVDDVIVHDPPRTGPGAAADSALPDPALVELLGSGAFDAAAIFTAYAQDALPAARACLVSGIPLRLAYAGEDPDGVLTDRVPEAPGSEVEHEVRRQLGLVAATGAPAPDGPLRLSLPEGSAEQAQALLEGAGLDVDAPWIVVHPGATAPARRYPAWSFAEVARRLALDDGVQMVVTGGADELELAEDLAVGAPGYVFVLAGQTSPTMLAGIISRAALVLSNDAAPVHIAAAFGVPVVDVYALTDPWRTPWLVRSRLLSHDVPCRWCHQDVCPMGHHLCLRGVQSRAVVEAVRTLLRDSIG